MAEVSVCYNIDPLAKLIKRRAEHLEKMKRAVNKKGKMVDTSRPEQEYHGVRSEERERLEKRDAEDLSFEVLGRINKLCNEGFVNNRVMFIGQAIVSFERQSMKEAV